MKVEDLVLIFISLLVILSVASAESVHGKIDVYFNEKLYPGSETAKAVLKINEPFTLTFNLTVHQKSEVSVQLSEISKNDFQIIDGPVLQMDKYIHEVLEKDESRIYEWTIVPTENWAGGSMPINFVYQIDDFNGFDTLVKGEFTAAYITVSKEYYNGEPVAVSAEPITEKPAKAPGFVLPLVAGMLLLAGKYIKRT
ncbi:MAG: sarcinarray family MAST domain-containing protein [Methanomethylovorans sp.]|uniref:sarcinarray family MAST domain-containing protein n=1 Tax=Methanomethylovorans sp. TaxID=2758717 RepID=UPI003C712932